MNRDRGFTLIELMVVVMIIAILIAAAIPSILGARTRAQDRAAQFVLRNATTAQITYYSDALAYTTDAAVLATVQQVINWRTTVPADSANAEVAIAVAGSGTSERAWMNTSSRSGREFCIAIVTSKGVFYKSATGCWADPTADPVSQGWTSRGF